MLTPAIRAKSVLPLPLLVSWVRADHQHTTVTPDDLALLAHRLHRRSYLHDPFRTMFQTGWLWWPGRPPLPCPRSACVARVHLAVSSATKQNTKRFRRQMTGARAALSALLLTIPSPVLVHDSHERYRATSVP